MDNSALFLAQCDALTGGRGPKDILTPALHLLLCEERWCQEAQACTAEGYVCRINDPQAAKYSIEGALAVCSNQVGVVPPSLMRLMDCMVIDFLELGTEAGIWEDRDVAWYNDHFDHLSIVELLEYTCWRVS